MWILYLLIQSSNSDKKENQPLIQQINIRIEIKSEKRNFGVNTFVIRHLNVIHNLRSFLLYF